MAWALGGARLAGIAGFDVLSSNCEVGQPLNVITYTVCGNCLNFDPALEVGTTEYGVCY